MYVTSIRRAGRNLTSSLACTICCLAAPAAFAQAPAPAGKEAPDTLTPPGAAPKPASGPAARPMPEGSRTVQVDRAARSTWTPVMEVLKPSRNVTVTDAQLERLRELPLEAIWGALQGRRYVRSFEGGFQTTVPNPKLVGRAVTMRYLPVRPDLVEAVQALAKEGDWDYQYNVRAGEDLSPGDVVVVELGGMVDRATFLGDVTAIGMKMAGAKGVVVDGGIRDLSEFIPMTDFPIYYRGAHASAMADQVGVAWNGPVRIGGMTVLPGDIIMADAEGVQVIPPQLVAEVIEAAENTVYTENFKREMMATKKYRARDVYPRLSPELEKQFEAWKKTHPKAGVKPNNMGGQ